MNVLSTTEALELLNERLQRPLTRQLFWYSILPVLLETGYARRISAKAVAIDGEAWRGWWCGYIAFRERKIDAGKWSSSRPYSAVEAERWRDGVYDDDPLAID